MERSRYLGVIHESADATAFVVLAIGAGWELRGRRVGEQVHIERWTRADSLELSPESIAALHVFAEIRLRERER
jgi:hypothetical protein